ncbi:MAG: sulfotransferase [Pseudomonadota bacterium]
MPEPIAMKRKVIPYPQARLENLDADVGIELPAGWDNQKRIHVIPKFLIIGAQKCGTTALSRWLSVHPNLQTMPLEWHFFDEVTNLKTDWSRYVLNPYFYLRDPQQVFYTFEKTPDYFDKANSKGVSAARLIHQMMPSAKFILLLRNPTSRAHSVYKMRVRQIASPLQYSRLADRQLQHIERALSLDQFSPSQSDVIPFTEMVKALMRQSHTGDQHALFTKEEQRMLTIGQYAKHLQNWFKYFDRNEQFLILFMEDFQKNPFEVMKRVLDFIEVPQINYHSITEKKQDQLWELTGFNNILNIIKNDKKPAWLNAYLGPMDTEAKDLLDNYFAPWNEKLVDLLPDQTIPWMDGKK